MSDCTNVEIRELLPEYLQSRVAAPDRARVEAHLASCDECAAELATLRSVRQAYARVPVVDVASIARALPKPRRRTVRSFTMLQLAAAISFISLGGISLAVVRSVFNGEPTVMHIDSAVTPAGDSGSKVSPESARARTGVVSRGISFGGGVSDLAEEDLEALLSAIESLEAAPPVDPDEPPQRVSGGARSGATQE